VIDFPKKVHVRGIEIEINSWDELDELVNRYGGAEVTRSAGPSPQRRSSSLAHVDSTLLRQFVQRGARGVLNSDLGPHLNAVGKGIRPALDRWASRIGLVPEDGSSAFEPVNMGMLGRGYRMTDLYIQAAQDMLGG
jgi:hypothetical protein